MPKKLDDKLREEIRAYLASCGNVRETARKFGVSVSTVSKIRNEKPDEFERLRTHKKQEHIESAWEIINLYMNQLKKPEMLRKATPHSAAVVIGTMWDKLNKIRELDLKEKETELKQRELERREQGPSDEEVAKVIGAFVRALDADKEDVWDGIEDEKPQDEGDEEQ